MITSVLRKEFSKFLRYYSINSLIYGHDKTMILKSLKIFSQNIHKNKLLPDTILENNKKFNILFIQEPFWLIICSIPSSVFKKGEYIIGVPNHLLWTVYKIIVY